MLALLPQLLAIRPSIGAGLFTGRLCGHHPFGEPIGSTYWRMSCSMKPHSFEGICAILILIGIYVASRSDK